MTKRNYWKLSAPLLAIMLVAACGNSQDMQEDIQEAPVNGDVNTEESVDPGAPATEENAPEEPASEEIVPEASEDTEMNSEEVTPEASGDTEMNSEESLNEESK